MLIFWIEVSGMRSPAMVTQPGFKPKSPGPKGPSTSWGPQFSAPKSQPVLDVYSHASSERSWPRFPDTRRVQC